jgi:serine/threonine protein kinase
MLNGVNDVQIKEMLANFTVEIGKRKKELAEQGLPKELESFVYAKNLMAIYDYILDNSHTIGKALRTSHPEFGINALRIEKQTTQDLLRTFHIVKDRDQFVLILETKRKKVDAHQSSVPFVHDPKTPRFRGGNKQGGPSYRIDTFPPEEWVSMVVSSSSIDKLKPAVREAQLSQNLVQEALKTVEKLDDIPISYAIAGAPYSKSQQSIVKHKVTLFSRRAEMGNLDDLLKKPGVLLTWAEKRDMLYRIFTGVKLMHKQDVLHQDIKPGNVLVYQKSNKYFPKLADFGMCQETTLGGTNGYESPEISLGTSNFSHPNYQYFHVKPAQLSYGKAQSFGRYRF